MADYWVRMFEFAVMTIAIVYLITQAVITGPIRVRVARAAGRFGVLLYCAACSGWWIGGAMAAFGFHPFFGDALPWALFKSALTGMVVGHVWSAMTGGNPMYDAEMGEPDGEETQSDG